MEHFEKLSQEALLNIKKKAEKMEISEGPKSYISEYEKSDLMDLYTEIKGDQQKIKADEIFYKQYK